MKMLTSCGSVSGGGCCVTYLDEDAIGERHRECIEARRGVGDEEGLEG